MPFDSLFSEIVFAACDFDDSVYKHCLVYSSCPVHECPWLIVG